MVHTAFRDRERTLRTARTPNRGGWLFRLFMAWFARDDLGPRA